MITSPWRQVRGWGLALMGLWMISCTARLPTHGVSQAGTYSRKMAHKVGIVHRNYLVHIPVGYDSRHPYPLVVVIHGAFSTAKEMEKQTGFSALADREQFIVLYPNGFGMLGFLQHWNSGHCCGKALRDEIDDVGFVAAAIEDVSRQLPIDRRRIYMVGNSNGGMLTHRFAAEHSDLVAAIAPVAATIGGIPEAGKPEWRIPQPTAHVPVIAFHGRTDEQVVYDGGRSTRGHGSRTSISVADSMALWVQNNALTRQPISERLRRGRVLRQRWSDESGADVVLYTIEQWGHVWPGRYFTDPRKPGDTIQGFDAAELIWAFCKQYQRNHRGLRVQKAPSSRDGS